MADQNVRESIVTTSDRAESVLTLRKENLADLLILHVDVGQGECTIVTQRKNLQHQWTIVIDGGFGSRGRGPMGRYLGALGIEQIDALVCTHFDGDHARGLTEFMRYHAYGPKAKKDPSRFLVRSVFVRNEKEEDNKSETKPRFLRAAKDQGIPVEVIVLNQKLRNEGGLVVECVAVKHGAVPDENDGSIGLLFTAGDFRYFTAGDLPAPLEEEITGKLGKLTAFKCGHHGSNNSTSAPFLDATKPKVAFISCGSHSFGHPSYGVIERLLAQGEGFEHVYLTNCIHNRKGVNPEYDKTAEALREGYEEWLVAHEVLTKPSLEELRKEKYGAPYAKKLLELSPALGALKPDESEGEDDTPPIDMPKSQLAQMESKTAPSSSSLSRHGLRFGKAAWRAAMHHSQQLEHGRATVAGSERHLGTNVLCVDLVEGTWAVGFEDGSTWAWRAHGVKPERQELASSSARSRWSDVDKALKTAIFTASDADSRKSNVNDPIVPPVSDKGTNRKANPQSKEVPSSVRSASDPVQSTPPRRTTLVSNANSPETSKGTMTSEMLHAREVSYKLFSVPTITGLRRKKDGAPWVPFCNRCRRDTDEPLLNIYCDRCLDADASYYHPSCYAERIKDLRKSDKEKHAAELDPEAESEGQEVSVEQCPECDSSDARGVRKIADERPIGRCCVCNDEVYAKDRAEKVGTCPGCGPYPRTDDDEQYWHAHKTCYQKAIQGKLRNKKWYCFLCGGGPPKSLSDD